MMSTWMTAAPPSQAARTCSPSRAKSAERIEGASSIKPEPQNLCLRKKSLVEILTEAIAHEPAHFCGVFLSCVPSTDSSSFFMRSFQSLRYLLIMGRIASLPSGMTAGNCSRTLWPTGEELERVHSVDVALREMFLVCGNHGVHHIVEGHMFQQVIHRGFHVGIK